MSQPVCWIIAGPNGAGKTTFALEYLPSLAGFHRFINADMIASGLSPLAPNSELVAASRMFLKEIENAIQRRQDFAFETTLSGRSHLRMIERLRADGWRVELVYLTLPEVALAEKRVAERVAHGGHDIPREVIERRFTRSVQNLMRWYAAMASRTRCFCNAGVEVQLVFEQQGDNRNIHNHELYALLLTEAG